jgi:anti-sigma factor (TIGR02949 family)
MNTEITSCEDALRVLAEYLDGELESGTGRQLERHLDTCRSCYSRAEFEKRLKDRVAGLRREPVSPDFDARVRTLIRKFTVAGGD